MGSLFEKDPTAKPVHGAFAPERLVKEVDHLAEERRLNKVHPLVKYGRIIGGFLLLIALSLYFLDPFVFASRKTQAIRAYLYQRQHGDEKVAAALLYSGYFDEQERAVLQNRTGNYMEFFNSPEECKRVALEAIRYIDTLRGIHTGNLSKVDGLNRFRYYLFLYPGILPPMPVDWSTMTPRVDSKYVP
ncbi:MAG: hypothetical protein ACAI35_07300 [Candidatus Methylacidiphilales bacterium]|nr:hypothetical protein [Candidatus Methylacidiphilales bacterium]